MTKSVLITGANSGIGLYTTKKFSENGFHVFAGYRRKEAKSIFNGISNVTPLLLDVTNEETIQQGVQIVSKSEMPLVCLINNAGIFQDFPLLHTSVDDIKRTFEVNYFGVHRMVLAFADILIKNKGRIINIGSISGILASFAMGGYASSKHAIEGYTDTLSKEMKKFDVHVCVVEPGNYNSNIASNSRKMLIERVDSSDKEYYSEEVRKYKIFGADDEIVFPEPVEVADTIVQAATEVNPKIRYLITANKLETDWTLNRIILEMLQLNERNKFTYSKSELFQTIERFYDSDLTAQQFKN